jgi:hypothetical protein
MAVEVKHMTQLSDDFGRHSAHAADDAEVRTHEIWFWTGTTLSCAVWVIGVFALARLF